MYGLLDSARISTNVSLVLDKLSQPSKIDKQLEQVCTKNICKHAHVAVTGKHNEIFLDFYYYFGALFNQNYFFTYHNFSKAKLNVVTFLHVAMVRWKIIKCRLDGSMKGSASKSSCQMIFPSAFGSSAREDAEQGHTQSETRFIYYLFLLNLYLTEAVMAMAVNWSKHCKSIRALQEDAAGGS